MTIARSIASPLARPVSSPIAGGGGGGVTPWATLLSDPTLILRLNGDANADGSGDANDWKGAYNGTWYGTPTYATAPAQTDGKAFDTITGRGIQVPYQAMEGLSAWSVCAWLNPRAITSTSSPWFGLVSGNTQPCIRMSGAKWQAYAFGPSGNPISGLMTSVDCIQVGRWDHIALTYNGTVAKYYRNGADVTGAGTVTAGKTLGGNNSVPSRIGGTAGGAGLPFDGLTSDFRAYSRAITATEALTLAGGI